MSATERPPGEDVSAQRRAELALIESEARWTFALQGAGDDVWDWNIQAGTAFFSARWKEMLGHSDDEVGGSADEWVKRVHPEDLPGVMADLQAHIEGKTPTAIVEYRLRCKDGEWKWVLGRGMVVSRDEAGKPVRIVGTNADITQRKTHETQLVELNRALAQKNQELEHALAAVKRLEGIIPICMFCKKIRKDDNSWQQLEVYISEHTDAMFSHGLCATCSKENYG